MLVSVVALVPLLEILFGVKDVLPATRWYQWKTIPELPYSVWPRVHIQKMVQEPPVVADFAGAIGALRSIPKSVQRRQHPRGALVACNPAVVNGDPDGGQ